MGLSAPPLRAASSKFLLAGRPTIADPDGNAVAVDTGGVCSRWMIRERGSLAAPCMTSDVRTIAIGFGVEQPVAPNLDVASSFDSFGLAVAELAVPLAAFLGLKAVLVADPHQDALSIRASERRLDRAAQLAVVGGQIIDQQVGNVLLGGANADVGACFSRELADQENEAADATRQLAFRRSHPRVDDALVDFAEKHARVHHLWRERFEKIVAGDDATRVDGRRRSRRRRG